jgi:hypothetical protein
LQQPGNPAGFCLWEACRAQLMPMYCSSSWQQYASSGNLLALR